MTDENMWMSQQVTANLFGVEENTITYHIQEIYKSKELDENATTRKIRVVRNEGKRQVNREIQFYNLDIVISVGYRVKSIQCTKFRQWATTRPREYFIQGFMINLKICPSKSITQNVAGKTARARRALVVARASAAWKHALSAR